MEWLGGGCATKEGLIILAENLGGILCRVSEEAWLTVVPYSLEGSLNPPAEDSVESSGVLQ